MLKFNLWIPYLPSVNNSYSHVFNAFSLCMGRVHKRQEPCGKPYTGNLYCIMDRKKALYTLDCSMIAHKDLMYKTTIKSTAKGGYVFSCDHQVFWSVLLLVQITVSVFCCIKAVEYYHLSSNKHLQLQTGRTMGSY